MNQEQANAAIAEKVEAAYKLISEAESLADEYKLDFCFDLAYGMGGTYSGKPDSWQEPGWNPSSQSC